MLPILFKKNYNNDYGMTTFKSFFDEIFDDNFFEISPIFNNVTKSPLHDIIENDKEFIVELSMAGIKKEEINVNVENNKIIINAERKENNEIKYNRKQTFFGKYERIFSLPNNIDKENINASFLDGILTIKIPKIVDDNKLEKKKIMIR